MALSAHFKTLFEAGKQYCTRLKQFWQWVSQEFMQDACLMRASALTFTSLLALVPLMVVVYSALSMFPFFDQAASQIRSFIFSNFVPHTGQVVEQYLLTFQQQASHLPLLGFVFLFVTAIMMMLTLERTLNAIWKVRKPRQLKGSLLLYWAVLTIGPLLLGASLIVSSYFISLHWLADSQVGRTYSHHLLRMLPFICTVLAFWFLYLVVPHCKVRVKDAFFGALVAAVLFEVGKRLFTWYVVSFPTYTLIYGALASVPLFLLWLYVSWIVFLFGAEVVNGLRLGHAKRSDNSWPTLLLALGILRLAFQAQKNNRPIWLKEAVEKLDVSVSQFKQVLAQLLRLGLLQEVEEEAFVLNCDLHRLSLFDLAHLGNWFLPTPAMAQQSLAQKAPFFQRVVPLLEEHQKASSHILKTALIELVEN